MKEDIIKLLINMYKELPTKDNYELLIKLILKEYLYLPLNKNEVIFLAISKSKRCIALFTNKDEVINLEYTSLDKVKIEKIIKEIFDSNKFYAITINPFTDNILFNKAAISILKRFINLK